MSRLLTRRAGLTGLAGLALASGGLIPAWAEDGKVMPVAKIFPYLEGFLKVPAQERARVRLSYSLWRDGRPAPDLKVALIDADGARTPLPVGQDGFFQRLPTLAHLRAGAHVAFEAPAETKLGVHLDFAPALRPATVYEAADLAATIVEANTVIGKVAGPLALVAPKMIGIVFLGGESGVAVFADGRAPPLPLIKDAPVFKPAGFKGATQVRLAKAPRRATFAAKA